MVMVEEVVVSEVVLGEVMVREVMVIPNRIAHTTDFVILVTSRETLAGTKNGSTYSFTRRYRSDYLLHHTRTIWHGTTSSSCK